MTDQEAYSQNMDFVARAVAYNAYLVDSVRRHLGDRVLDVGCGIGNTTALLDRPFVVGLDTSDYYLKEFAKRLPELAAIRDDIAEPSDLPGLREKRFDTIFCSNVLEHVEDDEQALANMREILVDGGRLALIVPNYPFLYGAMDEADLHFRRYDRSSLKAKAARAGFRVDQLFAINFPGIFWWYLSGKLLRRGTGGESEADLIDRVVPAVRLIDKLVRNAAGLSLVLIATKR